MVDSIPEHDDAPPVRGPLEVRVAGLLEHRKSLAPALAAFAAELPAGRDRRDLRNLAAKLSGNATPDELCSSPRTVGALLPLLAGGTWPAGAGERLHEMFAESAREAEIHRERRRVLAYPAIVALIALPVFIFLCVTVVPVLSDIFTSFQLKLPSLTAALVKVSNVVRFHPWSLAITVLAAVAALYSIWRLANSLGWTEAAMGFLSTGSLGELSAMASFTSRLSEGLAAELPLPVAVDLAGRLSERRSIQAAAATLSDAVANGMISGDPDDLGVAAARRFPAALVYALNIARTERASPPATAVTLLDALADAYAARIRSRFDWSSGFMPQFAILLIGAMVGAIVLALFLPLVSLVNGLTG